MIRPKLFLLLLFAITKSAFFSNKVFGFSGPTDEPVPNRFLLMDDPTLKMYAQELDPVIPAPAVSLSLSDVSQIVGTAISANQAHIDAESQESNSLDYELNVKDRKLNLLVSMQGGSLELKLSSETDPFNKQAVFTPDQSSTDDIKTFLTQSFESANGGPVERMLLDSNLESTEALFKYLKAQEDLTKAYDVSFPLSEKNKFIVIKQKDGETKATICYIGIEGESPKYLKIRHNLNEEPEIELFQVRHAVFIRRLINADQIKEIYDYIKTSINQVVEHMGGLGITKATMDEVATGVKALFPEFEFEDSAIEGNIGKVLILIGKHKSEDTGKLARIIIFPLPKEEVSINIDVYDRQYQAEFPLADFTARFEEMAPRIKELQEAQGNLPFSSVGKVVGFINEAIETICSSKAVELAPLGKKFEFYSYKGKAVAQDEAACAFADSDINVIKYEFGYVHFIHVVVENPVLWTEYVIAPNHENIQPNIVEIFEELKIEIEELKKSHAANAEDTKLLPADLEAKIKEIAKDGFEETTESSPENFAFLSTDKQKEIKVKLSNGYYKLSFMKKPDQNSPDGQLHVIKEVLIPELTGYDQLARIETQTTNFIKKDLKI